MSAITQMRNCPVYYFRFFLTAYITHLLAKLKCYLNQYQKYDFKYKMVRKWHEMVFLCCRILTNMVDIGHSVSDLPGTSSLNRSRFWFIEEMSLVRANLCESFRCAYTVNRQTCLSLRPIWIRLWRLRLAKVILGVQMAC